MDTQKDVLEQQALVLEPAPAPDSNVANLNQLFERLNDQQDQDGPDINEQLYMSEGEYDPQAYADYAAMQDESAAVEGIATGEVAVERKLSASELSNEIEYQREAAENAQKVLHMLESQRDNHSSNLSESDIADLHSRIQDVTNRLEQSTERLHAAESALGQLQQSPEPEPASDEEPDNAADNDPEQDLPSHRFVMSGLTGKSWEVQSPSIGDIFRQFAASRAAVLKLLQDDDEVWLVSGEFVDDGGTWKSHYHSPAVENLMKAAQRLETIPSLTLTEAEIQHSHETFANAQTAVEQELGLTAAPVTQPAPVVDDAQQQVAQPEINNGMEFLESGASLSSYVQRYRDALAAEAGKRLHATQVAAGNDQAADQQLANTNPRELERNSQNAQKGQEGRMTQEVAGPTIGAVLGSVASYGVQGISKLANSLSMAGGSVAQTISKHSYQRTEQALNTLMSQSEQDIAQLKGMGLQDIADADADSKPSLRTAFLAQEGVKPLIAKLGTNIDQAEVLASSLIRKGQAGGIEPDRVMRDSLGTMGDFAKRHKTLLDEIHDRNGKSFSERLDGIATGLLTYLKTLAMSLANRLNMNAGTPAAAGPRMG